jgi:hypothetical protein
MVKHQQKVIDATLKGLKPTQDIFIMPSDVHNISRREHKSYGRSTKVMLFVFVCRQKRLRTLFSCTRSTNQLTSTMLQLRNVLIHWAFKLSGS